MFLINECKDDDNIFVLNEGTLINNEDIKNNSGIISDINLEKKNYLLMINIYLMVIHQLKIILLREKKV